MLSDQERTLVRRLWSGGPSSLFDAGYSIDTAKKFVGRDDVRAELALLDAEFKEGHMFEIRAKFLTRQMIARLAPGASAALAKALAGPKYMRNAQGRIATDARGLPILEEAELTSTQLRAAEAVLDTLGLSSAKTGEYRGEVPLNALIQGAQPTLVLESDPDNITEEQRALSRERVRNTIETWMRRLPAVREKVGSAFALPPKGGTTHGSPKKTKKIVKRKPNAGVNGSDSKKKG